MGSASEIPGMLMSRVRPLGFNTNFHGLDSDEETEIMKLFDDVFRPFDHVAILSALVSNVFLNAPFAFRFRSFMRCKTAGRSSISSYVLPDIRSRRSTHTRLSEAHSTTQRNDPEYANTAAHVGRPP